MAKHRRTRGGQEPVAPGGPALWVEERRPFDNPYFGLSPLIHGIADGAPHDTTRERRSEPRRRGMLTTLARAARTMWSALRRRETPPR